MAIERSENWFLKKHDSGEVFGPVPFEKIREWADSAQVNPLDMLSADQVIWTKAPMIPDLEMDWLVVVGENLLYGPTTAEALLEFERLGEINPTTPLINCKKAESSTLGETPFFHMSLADALHERRGPDNTFTPPAGEGGNFRFSLQQRIRELEHALLENRRKLMAADETIARLEERIRELEGRIREYSGFLRS